MVGLRVPASWSGISGHFGIRTHQHLTSTRLGVLAILLPELSVLAFRMPGAGISKRDCVLRPATVRIDDPYRSIRVVGSGSDGFFDLPERPSLVGHRLIGSSADSKGSPCRFV